MINVDCFKAYDIRGKINVDINRHLAYRVGRAVAQHFSAEYVVVGFDARETSPEFASALAEGIQDSGSNVIDIGLAGTEEMYWAVTKFGACAGIEVTASHNPIEYNGMKIVKAGSKPLDTKADFEEIKELTKKGEWSKACTRGKVLDKKEQARCAYVKKLMSFVDVNLLRPLRIVINSGNGAAGPTFDAISKSLSEINAPLQFIKVNHTPDHRFPNGVPNPSLQQNHAATGNVVKEVDADFGVAFDGDFDRCFFFDENGKFIQGEYIVGLLASYFIEKEQKARIVHDPRVIWNTQDIVKSNGGIPVQSKTGHSFMKDMMRKNNAIYGGEMSAHHYFREFSYCDSGMIPWILLAEYLSLSSKPLGELLKCRINAFPSSGEINFTVNDPINKLKLVKENYKNKGCFLDEDDGLSVGFPDWRFNLRLSNTESLLRLNLETRGDERLLKSKLQEVQSLFL